MDLLPKKSCMWADVPPGETTGSTCARWLKLHLTAKLAPCSKEAADAVGADARAARRATAHARSSAIHDRSRQEERLSHFRTPFP